MSLPHRAGSLDGVVVVGAREALEAANRVVVGLVEGDPAAVERELGLDVCGWWRVGGTLCTLHGPAAVSRALVDLLGELPADRLTARSMPDASVLLCALATDHVLWSIELRAERGRFVGCVVRGASPPSTH